MRKRTPKKWQNIWVRYRLTESDYKELLAKQDNGCAICGSDETLCVDHCHETNEIRGILCRRCNVSIARLGDTSHLVKKAYEYLRKHEDANTGRNPKPWATSGSHVREIAIRGLRPQVGRNVCPPAASGRKANGQGVHARPSKSAVARRHANRPRSTHSRRSKKSGD